MIPLHLGALHRYEQGLILVLAFGPFVLLAIVILVGAAAGRRHPRTTGASPGQRPATSCRPRSRP